MVGRVGERLQDGTRGDAVVGQRVIQSVEISLTRFPGLNAARIHDLDGIGAGGAEQPGSVVPGPLPLAGGDLPQQILVVAHQREEPAVHAGRILQLRVAVARHDRGDSGVEDRGVPQAGVAIARR